MPPLEQCIKISEGVVTCGNHACLSQPGNWSTAKYKAHTSIPIKIPRGPWGCSSFTGTDKCFGWIDEYPSWSTFVNLSVMVGGNDPVLKITLESCPQHWHTNHVFGGLTREAAELEITGAWGPAGSLASYVTLSKWRKLYVLDLFTYKVGSNCIALGGK